jgi:DNA-binding winged helix-turn-helix (wHTH) protein
MLYRFANCELDTERHELRFEGELRHIEPQVFDLLALLADHPGRLISRDEIIEAVWGGRIVSESAIAARINAARRAVGDDGSRQSVIATVARRGIKLVVPVEASPAGKAIAKARCGTPVDEQRVRFCRSPDGTSLAFASFGAGPALVRAGTWLSHLEHDWQSPLWRPFLAELGTTFRVTRYDQRGNGLSDWMARSMTLNDFVDDLEAVVDSAGLDRFVLYGVSQGAPIAVAYSVRHPERVSHLVLQGGFAQGRMVRNEREREQGLALQTLIRLAWGKPEGPFIQAFSSMFIPGGTPEQITSLTELQRSTTSPENCGAPAGGH